MDWASSEWKQDLTPLALQKVGALEEKIEKLQKERQQKQLQLECQELALEREKHKIEREKQHSSELRKSLADICKDFENKQQKLQNELQSRDSRIKNLETLLVQSRKENSKLLQHESDLKDLSRVRENAISIREQKLQKKMHLFEQSITQEQISMTEDSSINASDVKELVSNNLIDNSEIENTLKKKIEEQEELIKELKTKLGSVSRNEEVHVSSNVFKTPAKSMSVIDSPVVHGKKVLNARDVFSSTPAKGNKDRVLGYGDSTSIDSGDEKLVFLQSRLKQLCQELECQRHNFEASKNALEMKYKESESTLKGDLKYQIQANTDLDKELKESRNKYQQEITQTTKQLDMVTLQLKKSEEAKVACERDLKSLESKISMNESKLRVKEEELQDLQKSKNACEATQQPLQSKVRELEKNCRALTEENSSLSENVRATRMQLEGSNNLVKEKEISLYNVQQELTNLQLRIKELGNNFTTQEARLNESQMKETLIAEQLEFLVQEKKELNDNLNSEIKRSQNAESSIEEQKQSILLLKEELNKKALHIDELKDQIVNLNNDYQVKLCDLENKFHTAKQEHDTLQNVLLESSSTQASLEEKIEQLEGSNKELSDNINAEKGRSDQLNLNLEEETQKMLHIEEELASAYLKLEELQNQMTISRNGFENELQEMNATLMYTNEKIASLASELSASSSNENNLKEKIESMEQEKSDLNNKVQQLEVCIAEEKLDGSQLKKKLESECLEFEGLMKVLKEEHETNRHKLEQELCEVSLKEASLIHKIGQAEGLNKELSDNISAEKNRNECLKLSLEEETGKMSSLKEELNSKSMELEELRHEMNISKNQLENEIQELNDSWNSSQAKLTFLENGLNIFSLNTNNMKEKLDLSEQEKLEMCNQLKLKMSHVEQLEICIKKEKEDASKLREKLDITCEEFDDLTNQIKYLKDEHESEIQGLVITLNSSQTKIASLEVELSTSSLNENNLNEKLVWIEQEKAELWNHLNMKTSEVQQLELFIKQGKDDCSLLKEKLESKCTELDDLKNQVKVLKECEANSSELKPKFHAAIEQLGKLQNQLQESSLMEVSLKKEVKQLQESNAKLSGNLSVESDRTKCLQLNVEEAAQKMLSTKEELYSKSLELEELENEIVLSKNQFESVIQALEAQLDAATSNENAFEEKLKSAEQEKSELCEQLELAALKVQELNSSLEDETRTSCLLREKLASYCLQLEELSNHMKNLSTMYESKAHELQEKFSSVEAKSTLLENQFKEYSLSKISAEEKIDIAEKEKKELLNQLTCASTKIHELELSIEEEKQDCSMLKEEFAHYCVEFEKLNNQMKNLNEMHEGKVLELETKFSSVEAKSMVLETQLKELTSNEISGKEYINIIESEKSDLLNQVSSATIKIQFLEECIEKEKQIFSLLKEDLENKCLEVEDLNNKMKVLKEEHKIIIHKLEEKLLVSEKELGTSQKQLADRSLIEISLHERMEQLESLNKDLTDNFNAERDKNECLQQNLQEETRKMLSLKEELSSYSLELTELTNQMLVSKSQFEKEIQSLEAALSSTKIRIASLETELKAESSNDDTIKEKLERVMQENNELSLQLKSESGKVQQLESSIETEKETCSLLNKKFEFISSELEDICRQMKEEKIKHLEESNKKPSDNLSTENDINECLLPYLHEEACKISSLKELSSKSLELEKLPIQMLNSKKQYETILEIKNKLSSFVAEKKSLENQVQEHALKLRSLKHEKDELVACLIAERGNNQYLELSLENMRVFVISIDDSLSFVESEEQALVKEIIISKKFYEDKVEKLENELSVSQLTCTTLKSEREGSTLNEMGMKHKLDILITEKDNLTSEMAKVANQYMQFEVTTQEQQNKIQDLESRLLAAQTSEIDFKNQLLYYASRDESLTASVTVLEKENIEVTEKLKIENGKREELQLFAQQLAESCASFEEELLNNVSLLEEANTLTNEFQNKIQDLEGRLFSSQMEYQNHLQDCSMNERNLKSSLTVLEKDNVEMSEKLTAELLKTEKLDLLVEQMKEQLEEFNRQKIKLLNESQRTIQDLQGGISDVQSKNVILRNEAKCHLLNEQILKKTVDSIAKEKQIIHNQLSMEASKIRILETGIGELKRMIMTLQVMLLWNNDDTNWAYSKKSASKELYKDHDYQRNVQSPDKLNLKSTTPKKSTFSLDSMPIRNLAVACKKVDFEEMALIQSCKEIEYSQALHKLSLHFLEEINSLEQGLIAKVEMLKFLYCYKLFEKKELSCLWKNFLLLMKRLQIIQFLQKFMSCVCNILKSNTESCKFDNGIKKLSSSLFEKSHLSTQDIFYLCGDSLNKVLFSVSQTLQQSNMVIKQCSIDKYSTVHSNLLPVVANTKFLLYLHHLSRSYINSELESFKQSPCIKLDVENVQKVLGVLKVQDIPYFMNYAVAMTEYIEKICSKTNNILQSPSNNFSTSSSPVLHIFKQYHFNCLDSDNDRIMDELCYWKKHCSIFGISECDIEKLIPLFECKSKNSDVPSKATNDLSIEINSLREECCALQNAVLAGKETQLLLNATIEEIEQDLGETFQQKEKYMKMVLETSRVLEQLKENIRTTNAFLVVKLENESSYDSCFCEMCIQQEESEGNSSHEKLTLANLFECIKKLVELGNQAEAKLLEFKQQETELASMYKDLQDRNSELEMTVASSNVDSKDTHDEIESLKYELLKEKENYQRICQTTDQKDSLILELESVNSDLSIVNEQYKVKLGSSEEKIFKLNGGLEELSAFMSSKEEEIKYLKKAMEKEALMFENAQLQFKEYESKIQLLNSTISKFEEEKALDKHLNCFTDSKSQKTISELQDTIESLKNANNSLNLTIETIEEELRTVYSEKQNIEELEKLTQQNIQLNDEVANATQKYIYEQQANKELLLKLETFEKLNVTSNYTVNDLRRKKEILDKDVSLLKNVLRDHEKVILKNNSSLKLKDQVIDQLNLKISEIEQENLDLNMQLEDNVNTVSPLKLQLNKLTEQCCIFEEEIKRLKLVEVEKLMLLENVNEMELKRDGLIKDANSLRMELEKVSEQLAQHEMAREKLTLKNKEASEDLNKEIAIRNSLEIELSNKQNEITDLNDQFQKLKTTTEQFRLLNTKQDQQNRVLSQKCEDFKKTGEEAKKSLEESYRQARKNDNDELIAQLKETQSRAITHASDFHILKSVFTNSIQFIVTILDITILAIKSDSSYPEAQKLKSSLLSALHYWKQCCVMVPTTENKFNEMFDNLRSFYETLANKRDEELVIRGHVESIIYTLNSIGQFCETGAQKYQTSNDADITNMSMFETTSVGNLAGVNLLPSSLLIELQQIQKLLDEYFSTMKNTINKQAEEMEMFKVKLNEIAVKQVSSGAESDENVQSSYKWKYNLIKVNNQKLEKDYNKLVKTYSEMEERVKNLEKEKQSLEEEADELASDFKKIEDQFNNSNELAETLTHLVQTQQKLKDSEKENNWLKQKLEYCRSNHGKKAVLGTSEGASNVLTKAEYKENVPKNGSDKFIS